MKTKSSTAEAHYNDEFNASHTRLFKSFEDFKAENKHLTAQHLVSEFLAEHSSQQNFLRYNSKGDSFTPDPFVEELLSEFPKRNFLFSENATDNFVIHQLPKVKQKHSGSVLPHTEVYNYELSALLKFLAEYFALEKVKIDLANSVEDFEDIQKIEGPSNSVSETTYRQVLIMHYIFSALGVSDHRTKQAKLRLIQSLTGKNADKILEVLNDPFTYKGLAGQSKDLQSVRKLFEDLELDGIVQKINKDLSAVSSKKNEK